MAQKSPAVTVEDVTKLLPDADPEQVKKVLALGRKAWPYSFGAHDDLAGLRAALESAFQPGEKGNALPKRYKVAGRLRSKRGSGGIAFLDIEGQDCKVQAILDRSELGDAEFDGALHLLNEGDWVGVSGYGMRSKRGEPSIGAEKVTLLAKAFVPFPDLGKADNPELRYGKPYLNLMQGPAQRRILVQRSRITQVLRRVLEKQGFIEVAIPVLEKLYGGANAKPFKTHSNAKDTDMFLRISHELALKKLLVGGLERVYHIGPAFRNEDIDTTHNPEFTLMECYAAYWDYTGMMKLTQKAFQEAVKAVHGKLQLERPATATLPARETIDFATFHTITMKDAIRESGGPDPDTATDEEIIATLDKHRIVIRGGYTRGLGIAKLFEVFAEPKLIQPTFVIDHPRETTPLCKAHRKDPALVERFELFIDGREHANSYSELNDPYLQARLFADQEKRRTAGDDEAPPTDWEFIDALKHGMPPAGGLGIGVDRMVMTLLDVESIKQVLPFPQTKGTGPSATW
ncbi:MAG TPA: lysine--tRNA ligase [Candidatus Thermoplasmatota archaeon]|nr:lysine--tRNA ligase [Candidatus Thermoplasmatota archaeon]